MIIYLSQCNKEEGGINLYGFVGNNGVGRVDVLGGRPRDDMSLWKDAEGADFSPDVHVHIEYDCDGTKKIRKARNAEELINAINTIPAGVNTCCIKLIRFMGHANRQLQYVGRHDWIEVGKFNDGWKVQVYSNTNKGYTFIEIAEKLCKKSLVELNGCNTARVWPWEDKNEPMINIARDISAALDNVTVQGNRGKSVGFPGTHPNLFGIPRTYVNGTQVPTP